MEHVPSGDTTPETITIARCRELLGDEAHGLSDEDVDCLRRHARMMADMIVGVFLDDNGPTPE